MVTHDLAEGFNLGRLLVFDKVRIDPQAPNAWGRALPTIFRSMKRGCRRWPPAATITFTH
jgi:hypothetical protein